MSEDSQSTLYNLHWQQQGMWSAHLYSHIIFNYTHAKMGTPLKQSENKEMFEDDTIKLLHSQFTDFK